MNNQHADINVGKPNFQPIPKWFMVWDKKHKEFLPMLMEIWQIVIHFRDRYHQLYDDNGNSRYIFCQFTNLFDKDGEEIFESHILDNKYIVEFQNGKFVLKEISSGSIMDLYGYKGKITGSTLQV